MNIKLIASLLSMETRKSKPAITHRGAELSEDGKYRYVLWRTWGDGPRVMFVGLNPSTEDATKDDPTIRRCINFAQREGFGGLYMVNLFAYRATSPKDMKQAEDPTGNPENIRWIRYILEDVEKVIFAWGAYGVFMEWNEVRIIDLLENTKPMCFGKTSNGYPLHPLYLPNDAQLVPYFNEDIPELI